MTSTERLVRMPVVASIGTIWAAHRRVQVQWTVGTTWVQLVAYLPGSGWIEVGTVTDLDGPNPQLHLADDAQWCDTPATRWQLRKQSQQDWQRAHRREAAAAEVARV